MSDEAEKVRHARRERCERRGGRKGEVWDVVDGEPGSFFSSRC